MKITSDIINVGVNDRELDLFEGQFIVPNGMAYNSYLICDEKIAVMDSVGGDFGEEWLNNIKAIIGEKPVDYLVILHMEPDHSKNITTFLGAYPNAKIVSSISAFNMMKNFFGNDFSENKVVVKEGDTLSLGERTLKFISAPMVHWPEVMMAYDEQDKVLFSADAFGKFGTTDTDEDWACEARRYYFGIVGKFGLQVSNVLKKISALELKAICALHGPALTDNLDYYINLYNIWSSYGVESEGVFIAYTSVYGNTKGAVEFLAEELSKAGCVKVAIADLARDDMAEAVEDAFRYGKIVLATTTYNGEIFPFMRTFIEELKERNFQNKTIALIENGTWGPNANKVMRASLEGLKNITFANNNVTIKSSVTEENKLALKSLATELC